MNEDKDPDDWTDWCLGGCTNQCSDSQPINKDAADWYYLDGKWHKK